jgi:hypothetical protein
METTKIKKLIVLIAITTGIVVGSLIWNQSVVEASPGQTSSCLGCHSQSSSLNIVTDVTTKTVSPGQSFTVNISWSGGTNGNRLEINWPSVLSNTQFRPTPRVPYSNTNATGTVSSTLTAPAAVGTYTLRVFVSRSVPTRDTDYTDLTIIVANTNAAPVLSPIGSKSIIRGQTLQFTVSATDANNDPLTYSASGLPPGAAFNATTRTFSWTPAANQVGSYPNITFQVSDGTLTDSEVISISVTNTNSNTPAAPVLSPIGSKSIIRGQTLQFTISATDANNDPLTYSASGLPSGAAFNATTRTFSWTPAANQVGSYPNITFRVSDGTLTDSEVISITVTNTNAAPVLAPIGSKSVLATQSLQFTVSATDANNDPLTYSASGLPPGAAFNASTGTFSWTPAANQVGSYPGITFAVSDGEYTIFESVSITVNENNPPPTLQPVTNKPPIIVDENNTAPTLEPIGNKIVEAGQTLQITFISSDADNDYLTYSIFNSPAGAILSADTGVFSWSPSDQQLGTYSNISVQVSDGSLTVTRSFTIVVIAPNVPPVLLAVGDKKIIAGKTLNFTIEAKDPNGDPLIFTAAGLPEGATFFPVTRVFSWTPKLDQSGVYNIKFIVSDVSYASSSDTEEMAITVVSPDIVAPKIINGINISQAEPLSATIQWTTDEPSTSQVEYWGSSRDLSKLDTLLTTEHSVTLTHLKPGTEYFCVASSKDEAGNLVVSNKSGFSTLPAVSFSDFKIAPSEVKVGEEVSVSVAITNNIDSILEYIIPFKVGGSLESTKTVQLAPGEKKQVTFSIKRWATGRSQVNINENKGFFMVSEAEQKSPDVPFPLLAGSVLLLVGLCASAMWVFRKKIIPWGLFRRS